MKRQQNYNGTLPPKMILLLRIPVLLHTRAPPGYIQTMGTAAVFAAAAAASRSARAQRYF